MLSVQLLARSTLTVRGSFVSSHHRRAFGDGRQAERHRFAHGQDSAVGQPGDAGCG